MVYQTLKMVFDHISKHLDVCQKIILCCVNSLLLFFFQLVMTDPVKQREMEAKVSQSQQKITEWQEELKHLKGFILYSYF